MSLEAKDLMEYLGVNPEEVKDMDSFKEKFSSEFVRKANAREDKDIVNAIVGQRMGAISTSVQKLAKGIGLEITKEIADGKVEDQLGFIMDNYKKVGNEEVATLKAQLEAAKKEESEVVKELRLKTEKLEGKKSDYEKLIDQMKSENENLKKSASDTIKQFLVKDHVKSAYGKIDFRSDVTEVERKGFEALLNEKYKVDLDENNNPFIADKTGARIPNPKVNGTFLSIEEIYAEEAEKNKLTKAKNVTKVTTLAGRQQVIPPVDNDNPNAKRRTTYMER